jgi:acetyltransferase-like isoleucine patch superfamily enzyme
MSWLTPRHIPGEASQTYDGFLQELDSHLSDEGTDRNVLAREILAQFLYGRSFQDLAATAPLAALNLDPRNVTLEAEYYAATDQERFARVKPLLWLWKNMDLSPAGQSVEFGVRFRRVLAPHVFARVGRNFKCFQNVEFSVGYNLEVGDDVVIHRNAFIDDIGGVTLHDRASLSDYVNVYSHTHAALNPSDVTLRHTTIGQGVRVTYHATVLAGAVLSDDSMAGALSVVTKDVEPHAIAVGIPAKATRRKIVGAGGSLVVDSRGFASRPDRKGNPEFPDFDTAPETEKI